MNYKQLYAIKKKRKEQIQKLNPHIIDASGIYVFYRTKEDGKLGVYVGQATKSMLERCANHLDGYKSKNPSHIDKSLKAHGLFSDENPFGWKIGVYCYCSANVCNQLEKQAIELYRKKENCERYNVTIGGQDEGKVDFQERSQEKLKRYKNGKAQAKKEILENVRTFFEKYLDFVIKGKPNKIKERKFKEFEEMIKGE